MIQQRIGRPVGEAEGVRRHRAASIDGVGPGFHPRARVDSRGQRATTSGNGQGEGRKYESHTRDSGAWSPFPESEQNPKGA
jgi:hypothetical protein